MASGKTDGKDKLDTTNVCAAVDQARSELSTLFRADQRGKPVRRDQTIERTIEFWQARSSRSLTSDDGRQIVENISGFFGVLRDWERAE